MKDFELVAVPPGPITLIEPLVVPTATTAVMVVPETMVELCAFNPWNLTAVAPLNPVPVIVTVDPIGPLLGLKLEMRGGETEAGTKDAEGADGALEPTALRAFTVHTFARPLVRPATTTGLARPTMLTQLVAVVLFVVRVWPSSLWISWLDANPTRHFGAASV